MPPSTWFPTTDPTRWVLRQWLDGVPCWQWTLWEPATFEPVTHELVLQGGGPTGAPPLLGAAHTRVVPPTPADVAAWHALLRDTDPVTRTGRALFDGTIVLP